MRFRELKVGEEFRFSPSGLTCKKVFLRGESIAKHYLEECDFVSVVSGLDATVCVKTTKIIPEHIVEVWE